MLGEHVGEFDPSRLYDPVTGAWTPRGALAERLQNLTRPDREAVYAAARTLDDIGGLRIAHAPDGMLSRWLPAARVFLAACRASRATSLSLLILQGTTPSRTFRVEYHRARRLVRDLTAEVRRRIQAHRAAASALSRALRTTA